MLLWLSKRFNLVDIPAWLVGFDSRTQGKCLVIGTTCDWSFVAKESMLRRQDARFHLETANAKSETAARQCFQQMKAAQNGFLPGYPVELTRQEDRMIDTIVRCCLSTRLVPQESRRGERSYRYHTATVAGVNELILSISQHKLGDKPLK